MGVKDISAFVAAKARAANNPVFGSVMDVTPDNKQSGTKSKPSFKSRDPSFTRIATPNTVRTASGKQRNQSRRRSGSGHLNAKILACPACNGNHVLMKYQTFEHNCFKYGHIARGCLAKGVCQVHDCKRRHHTLLHPPYQQRSNVNQASKESVSQSTQTPQAS